MRQKITLTIIIVMGIFNLSKGQNNLKQIDISEEPDFVDLQLTISKYWRDENKNHICLVKGLWQKDTVGFEIAFRPDLKLGIIDGEVDKTRFYKEGINIYSVGEISDNFIKALIGLFRIETQALKMVNKIESTTFVLGGQPENFNNDFIKTKVFFDDIDEKGFYSEWFVNIDLKNKILELKEKDSEYRENIIKMMTIK
jgi:hypothetical protein